LPAGPISHKPRELTKSQLLQQKIENSQKMGMPYKIEKVRLHERFEKQFEQNIVLPEINKRE